MDKNGEKRHSFPEYLVENSENMTWSIDSILYLLKEHQCCNFANHCSKLRVNSPSISLFLALFSLPFFCPFALSSLHCFSILYIPSFISLLFESAFKITKYYKNVHLYHYYSYHLYYLCQDIIKYPLRSHYCIYN